jgi:4-hydroxybenzoate polyprenyltransferase
MATGELDKRKDQKSTDQVQTFTRYGFFASAALLIRSRVEPIFIVWTWTILIACLIATNGRPPVVPLLLCIVAMVFIATSVYVYNDVIDADMDALNPVKKKRPLASRKVLQKNAMHIVWITGIIGLSIIFFVNVYSFAFSLLFFVLYTLYSYSKIRLKKRFLVKESVIAAGIPITSCIGMYAVAHTLSANAFFASIVFAVFTFLAQPALNDSTDIEEDRLAGVRSLAVVLSWKRRIQFLITSILVVMALTGYAFYAVDFAVILPVYAGVGGIILLWFMVPIMGYYEQGKVLKARKIAYVYYLLLQVFFVISSLEVF